MGLAFGIAFLSVFGLLAVLWRLLTSAQRRAMREIRQNALARGWKFRIRHWQGNPTAFELAGNSDAGIPWVMSHGQNGHGREGWAGVLSLRFPTLAGQTDFAIFPRPPKADRQFDDLAYQCVLHFGSSLAAAAARFWRGAHEQPTGLAEFDERYRVLTTGVTMALDVRLATRMLKWPADVIPQSVLIWRDPFALRIQARLPGPPSWLTVEHLLLIADGLTASLPAPDIVPVPASRFDRFLSRLLND